MRRYALVLLVLISLSTVAHEVPYSISPTAGSTAGGEIVTINGHFNSTAPYTVYFGWMRATSTTLIDEHTLQATTPPHLPGPADVRVVQGTTEAETKLTFEFRGNVPAEAFERILLPVLTPPIRGAYGSEFRTLLNLFNTSGQLIEIYGLERDCRIECLTLIRPDPLYLRPQSGAAAMYNGTPGRFGYMRREQVEALAANLHVYDTSRRAEDFGTEIPIVREREFRTRPFALTGVPLGARFRNTLRLYSWDSGHVHVRVRIGTQTRVVDLRPGRDIYEPAYAEIGDFPPGGTVMVSIEPLSPLPNPSFGGGEPPVWAFITVTNNETQHITTITPQPR